MVHDLGFCGADARATHVHAWGPLISRYFELATWKFTPIKFHECNSTANDTGGGVHRARAHVLSGKAPFS